MTTPTVTELRRNGNTIRVLQSSDSYGAVGSLVARGEQVDMRDVDGVVDAEILAPTDPVLIRRPSV